MSKNDRWHTFQSFPWVHLTKKKFQTIRRNRCRRGSYSWNLTSSVGTTSTGDHRLRGSSPVFSHLPLVQNFSSLVPSSSSTLPVASSTIFPLNAVNSFTSAFRGDSSQCYKSEQLTSSPQEEREEISSKKLRLSLGSSSSSSSISVSSLCSSNSRTSTPEKIECISPSK